MKAIIFAIAAFVVALPVFAQYGGGGGGGGGGFNFGIWGGRTNAEQKHLNTLRVRAINRGNTVSASDLDQAWEFGVHMTWKSGLWGFQIRPSYMTQSEGDGDFTYEIEGKAVAALFRAYPLESAQMALYFQAGVVWGSIETKIKENDDASNQLDVTADGANIGYMLGIGVEFNIGGGHGLWLEGGWRYLPIERQIASSASDTNSNTSVTQAIKNEELEFEGRDLASTFTGSQMLVGYAYSW